ncbi:hypothetical protein B0H94_11163 [Salsuginibacillus halophilus]|uniref:Uncharacterized protein n=1 Tax=Salsuginibacillus halophilus TaxID=517424 RepID=A0A2P8HAN8_9BACI|nr:hypothetical protein [Salsuginibacillus halophilus]PSL43239.1 hypothetical protein B0H94_11163 [Salsuginibacillus halophilus]
MFISFPKLAGWLTAVLVLGACTAEDDPPLSLGETAEYDDIKLTAYELEFVEGGQTYRGFDIQPAVDGIVLPVEIKNNRNDSFVIDRDF